MKKILRIALIVVSIIILLSGIVFTIYVSDYRKASRDALEHIENLKKDGKIIYEVNDEHIILSPKSENDKNIGIIFYQGGKVEAEAYIPLLSRIAEKGVKIIVPKMPYRLAVLGISNADGYLDEDRKWYIAGHSLGGAMGSIYFNDNYEKLEGLIILASYPPDDIDLSKTNKSVLILYATHDGLAKKTTLMNNIDAESDNITLREVKGGNHAQFGDYGTQKGDGDASISMEKQFEITTKYIIEFIVYNTKIL